MQHLDRSSLAAIAYQEAVFTAAPLLNAVTTAIPAAGSSSLATGTLQSAGPVTPAELVHAKPATSNVTLAAAASAVNGAYAGLAIRITGGAGAGARGTVVSYNGTTKVATVNWGTGQSGAAGVPAALDSSSQYELSVDCFNRGKVVVKVEYANATCTAVVSVALRDANGMVVDTAPQTPPNLGQNTLGTVGYRARGFEAPTDGMDTAFLQVETAASGGTSPSVSAWAVAV